MKPSDEINKLALHRARHSKDESHEENIVRAIIMYLDEQHEQKESFQREMERQTKEMLERKKLPITPSK